MADQAIVRVSFDWTGATLKVPVSVNGNAGQPFEVPLERLAPGIVARLQQQFQASMGQGQLADIAGVKVAAPVDEEVLK